MVYVMPTGFSTLVFGIVNLVKKASDFLKKVWLALISINKGLEAQMGVEKAARE